MASSNVCWGIELGAGALKALKLVRDGERLTVADFLVVPHKRPLSAPDVNEQDAMRVAIGELVAQRDLSKAMVAISVPGHASFARFAKLPPVEPKKVPEIVKFEAAQQIPFPIDEVEWDYQIFASEDEPDVEVGIFAVTRERVMEKLDLCADVRMRPDCLALSPVALFNAVAYDLHLDNTSPGTVIIDVGTIATDLIVIDGGRVWIRTFPMGGHAFTEAVETSFKLNYVKAEKLKREADQSKYKRQIFQAMRPAFADFGQEVQRSLQYYRQLHPESELTQVIGVGSTFRLPGLRKFLSQQLQIEVKRLEQFNMLNVEGPQAAEFQSAAVTLGTAYGLALQGLGLATIDANLIPVQVVREAMWKRKTPWFAAAAGIALAAGAVSFYRPVMDAAAVDQASQGQAAQKINQAKSLGNRLKREWQEIEGSSAAGATAANIKSLGTRRDLYAYLVEDVGQALAAADPQPEIIGGAGRDRIAPGDWRLFELAGLEVGYVTPAGAQPRGTGDLPQAGQVQQQQQPQDDRGGGGGGRSSAGLMAGGSGSGGGAVPIREPRGGRRRGGDDQQQAAGPGSPHGKFTVTLVVDSSNAGVNAFVDSTILQWLRDNAEREDAPYTFTVPSADQLPPPAVIQQGTAPRASTTDGAADQRPAGASSADAARSPSSSGASTSIGSDLGSMAPLDTVSAGFPPSATVYRYTITFEATLKAPASPSGGADGAASAQEFGS
ncbi:MAG: type IV pilus assembly protein PilM [Phycisphaerales bacterium]